MTKRRFLEHHDKKDTKKSIRFNDIRYSKRQVKSPFKYLIGIILVLIALYYAENFTDVMQFFLK